MMRASTLVSLVICRFVLSRALIIDNQLKIIKNDCFERFAIGHKLNAKDVYENLELKTVKDCQRRCTLDEEKCRTFSFGIGTQGNASCNLSSKVLKETADLKPIGTIIDPDFDLYIKKLGCKLVLQEKPEITHETNHSHESLNLPQSTVTAQLSSNPHQPLQNQHHSPQDHSYPPKPEKDGDRVHTSLISIRPDPHRPGYTGLGPALGYHDPHNPNHANIDRNDQQYYRPYHDYYSESRPSFRPGVTSTRPVEYVNEIPKPDFENERAKPYYEKYRPYSRPGDHRPYTGRPLGEYGSPHGHYDEYERRKPGIEYAKPVVVINPSDDGYAKPIDDYKVPRRPYDMYDYYKPYGHGYARPIDRYDNFGYNKKPAGGYGAENFDRLSWGYNDRVDNLYYKDYDKPKPEKQYHLHEKPYEDYTVKPIHDAVYVRPLIDHHKPSSGYDVTTSSYNRPSSYYDKPVDEYVRPELSSRPYQKPINHYNSYYDDRPMDYGRPPASYERPHDYGRPQVDLDRPPKDYDRPMNGYERPPKDHDRPINANLDNGYDRPPKDHERPINYDRPQNGYDRPPKDHEIPSNYDRPQGYDRPPKDHERPSNYDRPQTGYDRPPKDHERPSNYDRPQTGYDRPPADYLRPHNSYERPHDGYNRPVYDRLVYDRPANYYTRPMGGDYMSRPYHYEVDRPEYIDDNKHYAEGYSHWFKRPYDNKLSYLRPYDASNPNMAHPEESKPVSEVSPYSASRNGTLDSEREQNSSASDRFDSSSGKGKPFVSEMVGPHGDKVTSIITELSPSK